MLCNNNWPSFFKIFSSMCFRKYFIFFFNFKVIHDSIIRRSTSLNFCKLSKYGLLQLYLKRHTVWNEKSTEKQAKCRIALYGWCPACGLCQFIRLQCTLIPSLHWSLENSAVIAIIKSFFNLIWSWSSSPEQNNIYSTERLPFYFWLKCLTLLSCNHSRSNLGYRKIKSIVS